MAVVDEALGAIARPHEVPDRLHAEPFVAKGGAIEFEEVSFAYGPPAPCSTLSRSPFRPARRSDWSGRPAPASRPW